MRVHAFAPGRVNLMGDHTDYLGGLVLPIALDRGTSVEGDTGGDTIELVSDQSARPASVPLRLAEADLAAIEPRWARLVAAVAHEVGPTEGLVGRVSSDLPIGAGLSSSASFEVAVALALGAGDPDADPHAEVRRLAQLCQAAEVRSTGVPSGIMDQLAALAGVAGHALRIDCHTLEITPVLLPDGLEIVVVPSGQTRSVASSAYGERRRVCEAAEREIGPLRQASLDDLVGLADPTRRRRARHVISENHRVDQTIAALGAGDVVGAGQLLGESHASLRDDFEVSTLTVDALVERLVIQPGVYGARMTGAGFGGCVVALTEPGALDEGWVVRASNGATCGRAARPSWPGTPRR